MSHTPTDSGISALVADARNCAAKSDVVCAPKPAYPLEVMALVEAVQKADADITSTLKPETPIVELLHVMSAAVVSMRTALAPFKDAAP